MSTPVPPELGEIQSATDIKPLHKSSVKSTSRVVFDPITHQPPRIDEFGFNAQHKVRKGDQSNILKHVDSI